MAKIMIEHEELSNQGQLLLRNSDDTRSNDIQYKLSTLNDQRLNLEDTFNVR